MVDPIEIKLDEIDAKIDQIAYSPKYKATYEIDEMMKKPGAVAGAGAGPTSPLTIAGGIIIATAIEGLTKQSKILSTVQETIGNALGLLLDLVLLPFLPLLVFGIINLYMAVIALGKAWDKFIKSSGAFPDILDPNKSALDKVIDVLSWLNNLAKAWIDMMKGLIASVIKTTAEIVIGIAKFLWDLGYEIGEILFNAISGAVKAVSAILDKVIAQIGKEISAVINNLKALFISAISVLGKAWDSLMKTLQNWLTGFLSLKWLTDPLGTLKDIIIGFFTAIYNFIRSIPVIGAMLPALSSSSGGSTSSSSGSSGSTGGGNTFNLFGLTADQLKTQVERLLREQGTRYQS
jgi:phage-related protein